MRKIVLPLLIAAALMMTSFAGAQEQSVSVQSSATVRPAKFIKIDTLLVNIESVALMNFSRDQNEKTMVYIRYLDGDARTFNVNLTDVQWREIQRTLEESTRPTR